MTAFEGNPHVFRVNFSQLVTGLKQAPDRRRDKTSKGLIGPIGLSRT
jgi:hypothetical protein